MARGQCCEASGSATRHYQHAAAAAGDCRSDGVVDQVQREARAGQRARGLQACAGQVVEQMKCGGEGERPVSNRYEIEITVRRLAGYEQDGLARIGPIPGEYAAFARIGNMLGWAIDDGATDAAAEAAARAIRARVKRGDLIVDEDDGIVEEDES
jgi:hypothetical protein